MTEELDKYQKELIRKGVRSKIHECAIHIVNLSQEGGLTKLNKWKEELDEAINYLRCLNEQNKSRP